MKITKRRDYFWVPGGGNTAPTISFSASTMIATASVGDDVGTATISGSTTGTASWSLSDSAGGKYSINSSTGLVEVAGALSAGTDSITIAVSGLTPSVTSRAFNITVVAAGAGEAIGLLLVLTKAA